MHITGICITLYICLFLYFRCRNPESTYAYYNAFTLHMVIFNSKRPAIFHNIGNNWKTHVNIVQLYLMEIDIYIYIHINECMSLGIEKSKRSSRVGSSAVDRM